MKTLNNDMDRPNREHSTQYVFVVTVLWIGFCLAISFMETPLRFQPDVVTVPIALQIGRLVFHALNSCELVFLGIIFLAQIWTPGSAMTRRFSWSVAVLLGIQTTLLFLVLDPRTDAIIEGREVADTPVHTIYIVLEVLKLAVLIGLTINQIADFKRQIRSKP